MVCYNLQPLVGGASTQMELQRPEQVKRLAKHKSVQPIHSLNYASFDGHEQKLGRGPLACWLIASVQRSRQNGGLRLNYGVLLAPSHSCSYQWEHRTSNLTLTRCK